MFKKLLTILLLLVFLGSITIAKDKKYLLKPNGEKRLIQDSIQEIPGEVIKLQNVSKGIVPSQDYLSGVNDTVTYRKSVGNWITNFGFSSQEIMFTWFEAPGDMTIKSIGYSCASVSADTISADSIYVVPVGLRIIKLNWTYDQLIYYGYYYQGAYPSDSYGFKNVDPFGETATGSWIPNPEELDKLPPWTDNADPAQNTWEYDLWSDNGKAYPTIPVVSNPEYNWLNLASTGLGEVSLKKGEIYAIVAVNEGTALAENRTGIVATDSLNVHSWKFYQNSETPGWTVRQYTLDFAVIADVEETPEPTLEEIVAVRVDADNDFVPDRLGEEVTVEGVITSPSISSAYFSVNIQDESGAIVVYSPGDVVTSYTIGDIIKVTGTVGQYKGLTQIVTTAEDIVYSSSVITPLTPLTVTVPMLLENPENFESKLIKVNNISLVEGQIWPDTAGWSKNFQMTDGENEFTMRIDSDFDIDGNEEPSWPVSIIMNGGQYSSSTPPNDGYQYLPRMYSDFGDGGSEFYISFECDMSMEIASGRFNPASDVLSARGSFNGWSSSDVMLPSLANPNVFEVEVPYPSVTSGESIAYKFAYSTLSGDVWETGGNYSHTISESDISNGYSTVPSRLFNNISMNDVVQQESIVKFVVDMNGAADSIFSKVENVFIAGGNQPLHWPGGGWPDEDIDKVIFLSDDGTNGDETAGDNFWTVDLTFPIFTNTDVEYKYGANWGLATNGGSNDNEGSGNHHVMLYPSFVSGRTNDVFGVLTTQDVISDSSTLSPETIAAVRIDANNDFVPDRLGEEVLIAGTITSLNIAPTAGYSVEMQDGTAGIHLWVPGDSVSNYPIGSHVQVLGTIEQYRGLTEITTTMDNITLLGNMPFEIKVVSLETLLADPEKYESQMIRVNGLSKVGGVWPDTVGQSAFLTMSDGENQFTLRIDSDTDIDGNPEPAWPVDVIMYGGQYTTSIPPNDGYQYLPRMYSDFVNSGGECTGPDWTPKIYTNSTTAYGKVEIEGMPASEGDIVGAFVGEECRAVGTVTLNSGEAFVTLLIQGETVETVSFKIFDMSECNELNVSYNTQTNPGGTIGVPPNYLPIFSSSIVTQNIELQAGWNLISLNVAPEDRSADTVFSSIESLLSEVKSMEESYSPSVPDFLNTLKELNDGLAYWVRVTDSTTLSVEGVPIDYSSLDISLKTGWNLIGYPVDRANTINEALNTIWSELEEAKDLTKSFSTSVPDFLNTLLMLVPNSGYWMKVNANAVLTYPVPSELTKLKNSNIVDAADYDKWKATYYTNSATIYLEVEVNDAPIQSGVVAAFIGDECRGIGNIITDNEKSYTTIVVNGEEKGDVTFKVYDAANDEEIEIESEFNFVPGESNSNVILLKGNTEEYEMSLIPKTTKLYYAYPNPFNPSTEIKFDLHKDSNVKLSVYNMKGELVKVIANDKYGAGSYNYRWNGENNHNSKVSSGVYIIQLRTNEKSMSNKVILLK